MKKWGIWGLGVVGKSVIRHLSTHEGPNTFSLSAFDTRTLSSDEYAFLEEYQVRVYSPDQQKQFLTENDVIVPSPGIDTSRAGLENNKCIQELDLFTAYWKRSTIAITGSLGKTTLATALSKTLAANTIAHSLGGNIGTPLLDLIQSQDTVEQAVLELSSFQLELAKPWSPDLAIITNLYPNHLDRHGTLDAYFLAKYNLIKHQVPTGKTLLPLSLAQTIRTVTDRGFYFFSAHEPTHEEKHYLTPSDKLYTLSPEGALILTDHSTNSSFEIHQEALSNSAALHPETRVALLAACDLLGILKKQSFTLPFLAPIEHRLEQIVSDTLEFYNDSKSTLIESTLAAAQSLAPRRIHLLLGGVSKGVDRIPSIPLLKPYVTTVACFGKEADVLSRACLNAGITSSAHKILTEAFHECLQKAQPHDVILLSPGGTSFDLYTNYQERGRHFKQLVKDRVNPPHHNQ